MTVNRRDFLALLGVTTGATSLSLLGLNRDSWLWPIESAAADELVSEIFTLPSLPYAYDALEPYIDAETMQFHHDKHHAAYVKNLNAAVNRHPELKVMTAEELVGQIDQVPADVQSIVRNNGGGHLNHSMFWEIMSPNGGGNPTGPVAAAIRQSFGSFEKLKKQFNEAGTKQFGSGWAWVVMQPDGRLAVTATANQDSPLMQGMVPILGNDVWEHAYYLKYRNRRDEYLNNWWNVVNWEAVNERFERALTR